MRPIELARRHGLSAQAVRNYEREGVLPPASRTATGYRVYTASHADALDAFRALAAAHGRRVAASIMQAAQTADLGRALTLIDVSHAQLLEDRQTVDAVEKALAALAAPPSTGSRPSRGQPRGPWPIGAIAHQLRVRPATVRRWERAGLLHPGRDGAGARSYTERDRRDAHIVGQLRRSGYLLAQIDPILAELRHGVTARAAEAALADRRRELDTRARAMLSGAAALDRYLREHVPTPDRSPSP